MTRFKEIFSGISSCFSLTTNERLVILLILTLFLIGLGLRWRHLSRENSSPAENFQAERITLPDDK